MPVFAVVALASAAQALVIDSPLWSQLAFPVATYSLARYAAPRWGFAGLAIGVLGAAVAAVDWLRGFDTAVTPSTFLPYFLTIGTVVVTSWALGALGRTRQAYVDALVERGQRLEREAAVNAELAAAAERARIAREMHDVVAHGLSVMMVQAEGARYAAERSPSPEDARRGQAPEWGMAYDEDLADRVRAAVSGAGEIDDGLRGWVDRGLAAVHDLD